MIIKLKVGKRYWWYIIADIKRHIRSGFFTGKYSKYSGDPILLTKEGDSWSIPIEDLHIFKNKKEK